MSTTLSSNQVDKTVQPQSVPQEPFIGPLPLQIHQAYSGPIPHPSILEQYNVIIPDAAEQILRMAEKNAQHLGDNCGRSCYRFCNWTKTIKIP